MEKQLVAKLTVSFEGAAYQENGVEYWLARDLQVLLDYTQWRNFEQVIEKAKIACKNAGQVVSDHFADVSKTIPMPKGASKAKDLATEITNFNVKKNNLFGEPRITSEHVKNNRDVRDVLGKSDIIPEELPPEEDIKKLERRVKSDDKKILKDTGKLAGTKITESKNAE